MSTETRKPQESTRPLSEPRPQPPTAPTRSLAETHLWQIAAVRDAFWIGLGISILLFTYWLRSIFTPVLVGLILAYIFNPLISHLEQKWRVPRPVAISALLIPLTLGLVALLVWVMPEMVRQTKSLLGQSRTWAVDLIRYLEAEGMVKPGSLWGLLPGITTLTTLPAGATQQDQTQMIVSWTSQAFGYIGTFIETTTYVVITLMLIPIYFFSFAWNFDTILRRGGDMIPPRHRERTLDILRQMDLAVSGFFRGRLIVAFVMSAIFMLGWYIAEVPYWFLLGILAGVLNIVPYLVTLVWPLAVLLKWLDYVATANALAGQAQAAQQAAQEALAPQVAASQAAASQAIIHAAASQPAWMDTGLIWALAAPTIAYLVAQFLDNWLITPVIQARSSNLSAVTIIVVVLVGGAVGGLYGLLLAIPIAACLKILAKEVLIPHMQAWAREG